MAELRSKRILIVDDEPDVTELVAYQLRSKGYITDALNDPTQSIAKIRAYQPDLVILDVMMPDISGIQICRMLRADNLTKAIPVIFLTAKAEEADRVLGLEVGGDDYICKPFSIKELMLRVQGLIRRTSDPDEGNPRMLEIGNMTMDTEHHIVSVDGNVVELTATEFRLLRLLMERKGRVQTREHLLLNVWNYETEIETRTVDTHIRRVREKIGSASNMIETLRGVGYRLNDPKSGPC
jgi:two-component system phosphate regulon response regulator PhoB